MSDVSFALEAKSDQLNSIDIMGADLIIKIRDVHVKKGDQPISVFFEGDNNRPWKPSKGMARILAGSWGNESQFWIGNQAKLYFEPSVTWAGKEVGGIRIRALSDIPEEGLMKKFMLAISRTKRIPFPVPLLVIESRPYPADKFEAGMETMADMMVSGKATLQQIIAQCQKTGTLSEAQLLILEGMAPVIIDDEEAPPSIEEQAAAIEAEEAGE